MSKLSGLRVAITGGAQGIGRAIAQDLLQTGARVALGDIQDDAVHQTAAELGAGATGHRLDVSDPAVFESFLDQATAALGGLDALVNNAGVMPIGPYLDEDPGRTRRTVEINLLGTMTGTRLAGRRFAERGAGRIINIASVMGTLASPNAATYCATKYAVVGLGAALRQEWRGTGVQISTICPGFVRTELIAGMSAPGLADRFLVVDPEQVAAAVSRELAGSASRTVFVPRLVGWLSKGSATTPTLLLDTAFRVLGGTKVTTGLDQKKRAAYNNRLEGRANS